MYSTKEKLRLLAEIGNPAAVGADLALLRTVAQDDPRMAMFALSPERHSQEILMSLLEHGISREDIVANRRRCLKEISQESREVSAKPAEVSTESTEISTEVTPVRESDSSESKKKSRKTRSTRE